MRLSSSSRTSSRRHETLDQLGEGDLRRLAFYVAAEEIAQDVERLGRMDPWMEWWRGINSSGLRDPSAMDTTPLQLWKIMRPQQGPDS